MADAWVLKGSVRGPQGEPGEPGQQGTPGAAGVDGAPAGFGTPTASVDSTTGTPSVEVTATGPDTAKVFSFAFAGLKGEKGDTGKQGPAGADGSDATVTAGNGIAVSSGQVSVKLASNSGLSATASGLAIDFASDDDFKAYMGIS